MEGVEISERRQTATKDIHKVSMKSSTHFDQQFLLRTIGGELIYLNPNVEILCLVACNILFQTSYFSLF